MATRRKTWARRGSKKRASGRKGLSVRLYLEPKSMWRRLWQYFDMS